MDKNVQKKRKPKIGITMGDFNGVGSEVIIKALQDPRFCNICTPIIYGSGKVLTKYKRVLNIEDFNYHQYNTNSYLNEKKPNVINCWPDHIEIEPGKVTELAGEMAFKALEKATEDLQSGFIDAIVTAPINKSNIQSEAFHFPGHTEYFANLCGIEDYLMLMASDQLKIGVATGHVPLRQVPDLITKELLFGKINILMNTLKNDFGILKPKIAVLGLNPHAGEEGLLGSEEKDVIHHVIHDLRQRGNLVYGPFPADGFFGSMSFQKFDAILAMYHDQGLVPFKSLAFDSGVNYTAGLSIVRTSPDHGTGYNIAGKNKASESSMREAIFMACDIVKNRWNKVENQIRVNKNVEVEQGED